MRRAGPVAIVFAAAAIATSCGKALAEDDPPSSEDAGATEASIVDAVDASAETSTSCSHSKPFGAPVPFASGALATEGEIQSPSRSSTRPRTSDR